MSARITAGKQRVDVVGLLTEEVEISRLPNDVPTYDQGGPTSQRESLGFRELSDAQGDLPLEVAQHARSMLRCLRNHAAHALRTGAGRTSSLQRSRSSSTSMKTRTSSFVPSRRTCS